MSSPIKPNLDKPNPDKSGSVKPDVIKLALFGTPIQSSLSPFIHRRFAQQAGLNIDYQLIDTGPELFPAQLETFRLAGGVGCNITLPLKRHAWQLSGAASQQVIEAQSANTLMQQPDGGWMAETTDGVGLLTDLKKNQGLSLQGQRILLMGAGGAAAGVLGSLLDEGPRAVVVVNRNMERASALLTQFQHATRCTVVGWDRLAQLPAFNLIINATSLGHQGVAPALSGSLFAPDALCYDMNYFKAGLPLKHLCEKLGQRYCGGLGMLVEQAAKSFHLWTGFEPETRDVIQECLAMMPGDEV